MAEPKTRPTDVDARAYLEALPDDRHRAEALRLLDIFIAVTGEKPVMWGPSIIGFGQYTVGEGKKAYAWPVTGFAAPKGKFTLYVMGGASSLDEPLSRLGKHKRSAGCVYVNRLSDIDETALRDVIMGGMAVIRARATT